MGAPAATHADCAAQSNEASPPSLGGGWGCRVDKQGLLAHFFGPGGDRHLDLNTFYNFLADLHAEIDRLEFQHYDPHDQARAPRQAGIAALLSAPPRPPLPPLHLPRGIPAAPAGELVTHQLLAF